MSPAAADEFLSQIRGSKMVRFTLPAREMTLQHGKYSLLLRCTFRCTMGSMELMCGIEHTSEDLLAREPRINTGFRYTIKLTIKSALQSLDRDSCGAPDVF